MFLSFVIFRSKMQWRVPDHSQTFYTSNVTPSWWTKQSPPTIHHLESPDARCGSSRNKAKNVAMEDWFTISQFWNLDEKKSAEIHKPNRKWQTWYIKPEWPGHSHQPNTLSTVQLSLTQHPQMLGSLGCRRTSAKARRCPRKKNTYVIYCACLKRFCLHTSFNQTVAHVPETPTHWQHLVQVQDGKKWTQLWTKICEIKH